MVEKHGHKKISYKRADLRIRKVAKLRKELKINENIQNVKSDKRNS